MNPLMIGNFMDDEIFEGREKANIGARLELTRNAVGLDQQTFASHAGLKASTYNQYENGINQPQISAANALCDAHRITLDWIYRGDMSGLSRTTHDAIFAVRKVRREI